jgi:hypothetical protein
VGKGAALSRLDLPVPALGCSRPCSNTRTIRPCAAPGVIPNICFRKPGMFREA